MAIETRIDNNAYERLSLAESDRKWELHDGRLEEKPGMTWEHSSLNVLLGHLLLRQLDWNAYDVLSEMRVRCRNGSIFIPDVVVAPVALGRDLRNRPGVLAIVNEPLPLVIEVWSASTGNYDIAAKIPEYRDRGDLEIWRIHPYERTLTTWIRQPNGDYEETVYSEGMVRLKALPEIEFDLAELFRS